MSEAGPSPAVVRAGWFVTICGFAMAAMPAFIAFTAWTPAGGYRAAYYTWRFLAPPILWLECMTCAAALLVGLRPFRNQLGLARSTRLALAGLVLIDLGTALWVAPHRDVAIIHTAITILHILFGFSLAFLARSIERHVIERVWWALAGGAALYVVIMAVYVASIPDPVSFNWISFGLAVTNIRHVGFFTMIGVTMGITLAATGSNRRSWIIATGIAVLCASEFYWSASRSPTLVALVVFPLCALVVPALANQRFWLSWIVSMVGGGLLSLIHHPPGMPYGLYRIFIGGMSGTADEVSSGRLQIWVDSLTAAARRPFFGYGEDQFVYLVPAAQDLYRHPHNVALQLFFQWGVVGLALVAFLAFQVARTLLRYARVPRSPILPAFVTLVALCGYAMLDGVFYFVYPSMMLAALLAFGLSVPTAATLPARCVTK